MSPRSRSSLVPLLSILALACHRELAPDASSAEAGRAALTALVAEEELTPYDPTSSEVVGIAPERIAGRGHGDYGLLYVLSEDGSAIETRFRGPSGAVSAGLRVVRKDDGDLHRLVASMPGRPELATLAVWRRDSAGRVTDVHVRRTPVVEVRLTEPKPGQLFADRQWRPLERGVPVGEWR